MTTFHCFATHFTLIAAVQKPQKGGGKIIRFLKALFKTNSEIDVSRMYLKYWGPKFCNFTMLYELTKNECFLLSFIGGH